LGLPWSELLVFGFKENLSSLKIVKNSTLYQFSFSKTKLPSLEYLCQWVTNSHFNFFINPKKDLEIHATRHVINIK
jgi:hypothetical protein